MNGKLFLTLFALASSTSVAHAGLVTWDYTALVQDSNDSDILNGDKVTGKVTFDTNSPSFSYNGGQSVQYDQAITGLSVSVPRLSIGYAMSSGNGRVGIQDDAFGTYQASFYAGDWLGNSFSGSGISSGVAGIELSLNSSTDFLSPNGGTALPTDPYSLALIPPGFDQGFGAWVEFYPGSAATGYVRAELTNLTEDIPVPEPSSFAVAMVGLLALGGLWVRKRTAPL